MPTYTPPWSVVTNGHTVTCGIYVGGSSHFGHYVNKAVLQAALDCGWQDEEAVQAMQEYDEHYFESTWRFQDTFFDIVQEAEDWLNENTEEGLWSWYEGDFRVDAIDQCPRCGEACYADSNINPDTQCPDHLL